MKKILIAAFLLISNAVYAQEEPATFICAFQNGESFTVVGQNKTTMIQWGNGPFHDATATWEEPFLYVAQKAERGTFAMRWNVKTGEADGWTKFADGSTKGGPLFCAFK